MQTSIGFESLYSTSHPCNTKNLNKRVILDMIRFAPSGISRADLARQMDLTRAAITTIINDLMGEGLVRETETSVGVATTGGRRPIHLEINPQRSMVLGIDMASTHLSILLTDFSGHVLHEVELPFNIKNKPADCLNEVDHQVRLLLEQEGLKIENIAAWCRASTW